MGQIGGDGHHRNAGHVRGELGDIDGLATANTGHRFVEAGPQVAAESRRRLVAAVGYVKDLRRADVQFGHDGLTLTGPDGDCYPAVDGDPAVSEQGAKTSDSTRGD